MALNNTTADATAALIAAAVTGLSEADKQDPVAIWKAIVRVLYTRLKADTVVSLSGNTAGGDPVTPGTGTLT